MGSSWNSDLPREGVIQGSGSSWLQVDALTLVSPSSQWGWWNECMAFNDVLKRGPASQGSGAVCLVSQCQGHWKGSSSISLSKHGRGAKGAFPRVAIGTRFLPPNKFPATVQTPTAEIRQSRYLTLVFFPLSHRILTRGPKFWWKSGKDEKARIFGSSYLDSLMMGGKASGSLNKITLICFAEDLFFYKPMRLTAQHLLKSPVDFLSTRDYREFLIFHLAYVPNWFEFLCPKDSEMNFQWIVMCGSDIWGSISFLVFEEKRFDMMILFCFGNFQSRALLFPFFGCQ